MEEQLIVLVDPWQDKYERLLEAHEKLQRLNQCLEDKLLKLAEEYQTEKTQKSEQIQDLTQRLVEARLCIHQLEDENERYRNDINVVIQLLQCKPTSFISPKIDTLPEDLQRKVLGQRNAAGPGRKEKKIIKVQVPTLPPMDIMYAVDKGGRGGLQQQRNGGKDIVSAAILAKVLQERENERKENQKNRCHCASRIILPTLQKETQTLPSCTISYSDFPYVDESTKTPTQGNTSLISSNNNCHSLLNSRSVIDESQRNGNYDDMSRSFDRYDHHEGRQGLMCRETSFSHPRSSFSSSSSPTSSTTSSSYSCSTHPHQNNNAPLTHSGILLENISFEPPEKSSSLGVVKNNTNSVEELGSNLESKIMSSYPEAIPQKMGQGTASRKMAGHCVRVIDDTELMEERLYNDRKMNNNSNGFSNGTGSHWRKTILVQPPPKSHSSHDSLSWFMTVSPPPLYTAIPASDSEQPPTRKTSSVSSSANDSPRSNVELLDTTDSVVMNSSSSSSLPSEIFPQASEPLLSSSQRNINPLNSYYGLSHHTSGNLISFPWSSQQQSHQPHQYYRAQKRTFWTRSSSTTSTETEI